MVGNTKMNMKKLHVAILAASLATAMTASATMVTYNGTAPGQVIPVTISGVGTVSGWAGVYNLTVDGVATPSFCIDVYRDIQSGQGAGNYQYASLDTAPLAPSGPMGLAAAVNVEKLWAAYYASATSLSNPNRNYDSAVLQLAIWEEIAVGSGHTVSGSGTYQTDAQALLLTLGSLTAQADLVALVEPPPGDTHTLQEFVVPVPEATTMIAGALLLLPLGASTLRILRRNRMS